jgi:hypothetical protein
VITDASLDALSDEGRPRPRFRETELIRPQTFDSFIEDDRRTAGDTDLSGDFEKTRGVEGLVEACAKAAQVSPVPDEATTTDTREPSHMFLAAEWDRSSVSERTGA